MEISLRQHPPEQVKNDIPLELDPVSVPLHVRRHLYNLDVPLRPWEIRLLKIHPSSVLKTPVTCELLVADLIALPGAGLRDEYKMVEYEALSYSWGYPAFTHSITCNGMAFPVGQALHEALRYLRESDKVRYLWCDACCIDQGNPTEKAGQVQTMFTIFQKARRVLAWLGLPSAKVEYLFTALDHKRLGDESGGESGDQSGRLRTAALELISTLPYFRRCWIRQELEAAREVVVVCGTHAVPLADFRGVLDASLPTPEKLEARCITLADPETRDLLRSTFFLQDPRSGEPAYNGWRLQEPHQSGDSAFHGRRWFNTIMRSAVYEATLPQDKIFSVLSITDAHQQYSRNASSEARDNAASQHTTNPTAGFPAIDYTKPVSVVFQDFIKHTINIEENLDCLCVIQDRSATNKDLPSWVIDLRVDIPRCQFRSSTEHSKRPEKQTFDDSGVLVVRGQMLGHIGSAAVPQSHGFTYFAESFLSPPGGGEHQASRWIEDCFTSQQIDAVRGSRKSRRALERTMQKYCNYKWKEIVLARSATNAVDMWFGRRKNLSFAFVSVLVEHGDLLVLLQGSHSFFVLRKQGDNGRYTFLGPAMVYGGRYTRTMGDGNDSGDDESGVVQGDSLRTTTTETTPSTGEKIDLSPIDPVHTFQAGQETYDLEIGAVEEFLLV